MLSSSVSVYTTADNAVKGISKTGTYPAGKYYIYKVYGGAVNISRTPGTPGAWINPSAVSGQPSPSVPTYINMSGEISVDNIYAMIKKLSTDYSNRPVGSVTGKNAAAYIQNTLKSYGYNTSLQPFTASSLYNVQDIDEYNTVRGNNVTAELPGFDPSKKTVVFLCHHDSVIGTPGANDNASGVAVMMETARYLQGKKLDFNPVFLIADAEETGKEGTEAWIKSKTGSYLDNIEVVIDTDMAGKGNYYQIWNTTSYFQSQMYPQLTKQIAGQMNLAVGMALHARGNSDYREFENRGIKAVILMNLEDQYGNKESTYHTPNDTYDKISKTTLKNVSDIILNLIRHIGR